MNSHQQAAREFEINTVVQHPQFGTGVIVPTPTEAQLESNEVAVRFTVGAQSILLRVLKMDLTEVGQAFAPTGVPTERPADRPWPGKQEPETKWPAQPGESVAGPAADTPEPTPAPEVPVLAADVNVIRHVLQRRYRPGQIIELRVPGVTKGTKKVVLGGIYTDREKLTADIAQIVSTTNAPAIYTGLQEIRNDMAHRAAVTNDLATGRGGAGAEEIERYLWLLIDVDAIRAEGFEKASSTDAEKASALDLLNKVVDYFVELGVHGDVVDSGNSYHFIPAIDLPATFENEQLIRKVLESLAAKFDTSEAHIDTSVYDRPRICKLPGTLSRKGISTPDRPHRLSTVVSEAAHLQAIPPEVLRKIAGLENVPQPAAQVAVSNEEIRNSMDYVLGFADWAGFRYGKEKPHEGGLIVVLESVCPFPHKTGGHHAGECHIGVNKEGKFCFSCKHNSCRGKHGWKEFRAEVERQRGEVYQHGVVMCGLRTATTAGSTITSLSKTDTDLAETTVPAAAMQGEIAQEIIDRNFPAFDGKAPAKVRMLIEGFLRGGTNFFGALSGAGKTWLALTAAKALTTGEPMFGIETFSIPCITPVLYLIPEDDEATFKYRLGCMRMTQNSELFRYRTCSQGTVLPLTNELTLAAIEYLHHGGKYPYVLVVVDTAVRFMVPGKDMNQATNNTLSDDKDKLQSVGADLLFLHHATKMSAKADMTLENILSGTGDFGAMADCVWGLRRDEKLFDYGDGPEEVDVINRKLRAPVTPKSFRIRLKNRPVDGDNSKNLIEELGSPQYVDEEEAKTDLGNRVQAIIANDPKVSVRAIKEELHLGHEKVRKLAKERGWVQRPLDEVDPKTGKTTKVFYWTQFALEPAKDQLEQKEAA
jgi:AAA domain